MNWAISEKGYSQRRACSLVGQDRKTYRYASRRPADEAIRKRLRELASERRRFGYRRPAGGFFLWLDMEQAGGSVEATVTLWKRCGVKVLPGAYLAQRGRDGTNPGEAYIRVALVHDAGTIREALERIVSIAA